MVVKNINNFYCHSCQHVISLNGFSDKKFCPLSMFSHNPEIARRRFENKLRSISGHLVSYCTLKRVT